MDEEDEEELDEAELDILREAGILPKAQPSKRRRRPAAKHIVFAEDEDEGKLH